MPEKAKAFEPIAMKGVELTAGDIPTYTPPHLAGTGTSEPMSSQRGTVIWVNSHLMQASGKFPNTLVALGERQVISRGDEAYLELEALSSNHSIDEILKSSFF